MRHFLILSILVLPVFSCAATMQAGFPSQAIWVSKQSAVEGETIVVSTIVLNSGSDALRATLVFTADGTRVGAREFELPGGESQIHSIEWKPKKGEHKVAARIEGTSATLSQKETSSVLVTITEPPTPSAAEKTIMQVKETAATIASSSAPIVADVAEALFAQTEKLRGAGIERLENYLASQSSSRYVTPESRIGMGAVAGTSTRSTDSTPSTSSEQASNVGGFDASQVKGVFSAIAQGAAAAALFTMKSMMLFYPLLALLLFGLLYGLARRVRRKPSD